MPEKKTKKLKIYVLLVSNLITAIVSVSIAIINSNAENKAIENKFNSKIKELELKINQNIQIKNNSKNSQSNNNGDNNLHQNFK